MNASEFWDEKYKLDDYFFGTQPNQYIKKVLDTLPTTTKTTLIEIACGEGRNSNYACETGIKTTASDVSERGLKKTRLLAQKNGHQLETIKYNVLEDIVPGKYDIVVVSFLHFEKENRKKMYQKIESLLNQNGHFIAEWYHPNQRNHQYTSGGPPSASMMPTLCELEESFQKPQWSVQELSYALRTLQEGSGHNGLAALCQIHAQYSRL